MSTTQTLDAQTPPPQAHCGPWRSDVRRNERTTSRWTKHRSRQLLWSMATCAVLGLGSAQAQSSPGSANARELLNTMRLAAETYPSVLAERRTAQAESHRRRASQLDALSATGSVGLTRTTPTGEETPSLQRSASVGIQLTISLATWLQVDQHQISEAVARSALRALQITLAAEAARAHFDYANARARLAIAQRVQGELVGLKRRIESQSLSVDASTMAQLDAAISAAERGQLSETNAIELTIVELERLTGRRPQAPQLYAHGYVQKSLQADWPITQPGELAALFPLPATVELAFARAQQSPALVQTRLQENLTRVNWHLDFWSQNGPTLTLSLSRDAQVLERRGYEGGLERDDSGGTSASAVLSFRLGAGAPLHLRTLGLLQEASRYSRLAKEREIRAQITQTYLQLRGLTAQLQSASDSFRQVRTALQNTTVQNSDDVDTYMSLVSSAEGLANSIVQLTAQETLLRIQAQSLIGSLLDSLERGPATRARRQP